MTDVCDQNKPRLRHNLTYHLRVILIIKICSTVTPQYSMRDYRLNLLQPVVLHLVASGRVVCVSVCLSLDL